MLKHPDTLAASVLGSSEEKLFECTVNKELFGGIVLNKEESQIDLEEKIRDMFGRIHKLLPQLLVVRECDNIDQKLLDLSANNEEVLENVRTKMSDEVKEKSADEIINKTVHTCIQVQNRMFMGWTQSMRMLEPVEIDKEIQMNDWFTKSLEGELNARGYETVENSHNEYCIFGKSRPDFVFKRKDTTFKDDAIKAGVVMPPSFQERFDIEISGHTVEWKVKDTTDANFPQAIANMVRVACNLVKKSLKFGKISQYMDF